MLGGSVVQADKGSQSTVVLFAFIDLRYINFQRLGVSENSTKET